MNFYVILKLSLRNFYIFVPLVLIAFGDFMAFFPWLFKHFLNSTYFQILFYEFSLEYEKYKGKISRKNVAGGGFQTPPSFCEGLRPKKWKKMTSILVWGGRKDRKIGVLRIWGWFLIPRIDLKSFNFSIGFNSVWWFYVVFPMVFLNNFWISAILKIILQ